MTADYMAPSFQSTWPPVKIDDIAERVAMGPFGSSIPVSCFADRGVPVISGAHLQKSRLCDGPFNYVTEEKADQLRNSNAFPGDVVFTHSGTIGQVSLIPEGSSFRRYVISQRQFLLRCKRDVADPAFVTYFFRSTYGQHLLKANSSPSGVPSIARPVTYLRSLEIPLPPLPEQRAIAHILGTLDDKVDFDPVRAKAAGRQPAGMDAATAALFPDSFEESALGHIPKGWRAGSLGEVAQNLRRAVNPADVLSGTPYIGLEHMPRKSIALAEWGQVDGVTSGKFQFRCGELLFGKLRPYFHKVGVAPVDGVCSTDILVVTPKSVDWFGFVLGHVSSEALVDHANATSTGTKMPRTNWKDLAAFGVAMPPPKVAAAFTSLVRPMVDLIISNIHQSRTLAAIRDTLLPKLMSGEIRVQDAEAFAEVRA
jgi:type I restriction enzyme S subunit